MGKIAVLDDDTIDKIAAGEVIERPASVVKELVENALDSGATSIYVSVDEGGRHSIVVRDDGCGMSKEDAVAAFTRHATSKIRTIDDLERVASFGFRGEALSSVAAVARVRMRTREHGTSEGTEVSIAGGRSESVRTAGCPPGTDVSVEDLFFNVPARRKSLRSKGVELAHCREVVVSYTLCRPGTSFTFSSDGKVDMVHSSAEGMNGSLVAAFGPKAGTDMLHGKSDSDGLRVEVHLARLEHTRSSPSDLKVFVNDRPVRSQRIVSSVVKAFGSKLMKDRYPLGVVKVSVDGPELDVNVHPTKREVRFDDEQRVAAAVESAVSASIEGPDLSFRYDLTRFAETFVPGKEMPSVQVASGVQSTLSVERTATQETARPHHAIVPLAQIMDTYILAESGGNLLLIDQHAAAERVVYEGILRAAETGKEVSQRLLTPLVLSLTPTETRVLEENKELLLQAGFAAEPFGGESYALRSIPTVLGVAQGETAFRAVLGDLAHTAPQKRLGLEVIWRVACHTATRAGQTLSMNQMRQLVTDLMAAESPWTCEHGRPTMIALTPVDLERLFKRRV